MVCALRFRFKILIKEDINFLVNVYGPETLIHVVISKKNVQFLDCIEVSNENIFFDSSLSFTFAPNWLQSGFEASFPYRRIGG